ncbi:MAG: TonB-dependent receptor [Chitinophagaceae bacterium]|nr:MAG: TonB-dependent receptor [Chitinophagaceae bacterium]
MKGFFVLLFLLTLGSVQAQQRLTIVVKFGGGPVTAATVQWKEGNRSTITDSAGLAFFDGVPAGKQTFFVTHIGHEEITVQLNFPLSSTDPVEIELGEAEEDEEEVIITTTRTSRTISNTPTRVEVISGEELEEKGNMKPGDIRMLLNESTGIQTQQTSATSYNSSIRIQGLDGRYTQILRDGFPLYAGFSGGLSIMQIAPLDLKQVEVIKGSASTLYGGGAIAGLVNLVSKTPGEEKEISFMANATSAKGLDLSGFYSQRFSKLGVTVFGSRNTNEAFDPAAIGLTAIPKFERYTINPRLFFYGEKTEANIGVNYTTEDRIGGNVSYIKNGGSGYFEKNNTSRITTQASLSHKLSDNASLNLKNSYSHFDRMIRIPSYVFEGTQQATYTELNVDMQKGDLEWIGGLNVYTDHFKEAPGALKRDYAYNTFGTFVQNTWTASDKITLETGLRGDYNSPFGFALLPRFSVLYKASPALVFRVGGGAGYKIPTIFNEEAEREQFRNIPPIEEDLADYERSVGGNADVNYRTRFGELGFSINQLFFYTRVNKPFVRSLFPGFQGFRNADGFIDTKGGETNIKLTYSNFKLFIGYTYTDANTVYNKIKERLPLTAKHRLNNVLMFEKEDAIKIGLEAYYFSPQQLSDNASGKSYWITGLMVEKLFPKFSVFINFENFTDTRQSKFDRIYEGSIDQPVFRDIYAPVEGFVVNGGFKLRL